MFIKQWIYRLRL